MTLTTRLNLFVLAALGLVLAGFSLTLHLAARTYLYRQVDNRLSSALSILSAAAEFESGLVEWEPSQRLLSVGSDAGSGAFEWLVADDRGQRVDGFPPPGTESPLAEISLAQRGNEDGLLAVDWHEHPWRLGQRWVPPESVSSVCPRKLFYSSQENRTWKVRRPGDHRRGSSAAYTRHIGNARVGADRRLLRNPGACRACGQVVLPKGAEPGH